MCIQQLRASVPVPNYMYQIIRYCKLKLDILFIAIMRQFNEFC